jgi:hypothetical protein
VAEITALIDANVLASMTLTDLVIETAHHGLFTARWTDDIHAEWMRAVVRMQPSRQQALLDRRRDRMNANAPGCLVAGYQPIIPSLALPDPNDRHVLAAAIVGSCTLIVTKNLKDFPPTDLAKFGIEAVHPDTFFLGLLGDDLIAFMTAIRAILGRMKNPRLTVDAYLAQLNKIGMPLLAAALERHKTLI